MVFLTRNIKIMMIAILFVSTAIPETALSEATFEKVDAEATTEGGSETEKTTFCLNCAFGRFGMMPETTTSESKKHYKFLWSHSSPLSPTTQSPVTTEESSLMHAGSSGWKSMTRNALYSIMQSSKDSKFDAKLKYMEHELLKNYSEGDPRIAEMKQKLSDIEDQFKRKWSAAHETKSRFEESNAEWLKGNISLPISEETAQQLASISTTTASGMKKFLEEGECTEEAKKNKTVAAYCLETTTQTPATTAGNFMGNADTLPPPPPEQNESESCPPDEEFKECDFLCQPSCKRPKIPRRCPYICLPRCLCKKPLVRRESDGKCVPLSTCPKCKKNMKYFGYRKNKPNRFPYAQRYKYGPPIEEGSPSGQRPPVDRFPPSTDYERPQADRFSPSRDYERPPVDRSFPPTDYERRWKKCPPQETFSMCAGACQPTCSQPKPKCNRGCICKKPFVRREDGKCVPRSKCHCKKRKSCYTTKL